MPFAYAGTRRRRNRDRRRTHESPENSAASQSRENGPDAREERDPLVTRRASGEESPADREAQRATTGPDNQADKPAGIGSQDLHDPGSREPDAPPVDNRS
ncbi:hypothetical protein [Cupriavidus sp. D384]|uniref:hypothetical protein n=1 Tax=Cupriavidus sp. D384 TaxID=1538095 RepID=UPI00082DBB73|nr:hypothetical protein [Cupriavidus sp. D384]